MQRQFDFNPQDIDEGVAALPIPDGLNLSMSASRMKDGNLSSHRKVLKDLQMFIKDSKNKQNQRIKQLKIKQRNLGEEMAKQQAHKQMKMKELENQLKQKALKECTFKPKTNQKGPKRNFNQFVETQNAHSQKVKNKTEKLKKDIEQKKQKGTYRPKINANYSRKKDSAQSNSTVFERLYSLSEKQKTQISEPVNSFHPTINARSKNMTRDGPVQQMLYGDALRRQQKSYQPVETSVVQRPQKHVNYNNEKYAAQKFIKEYFFTLEDLQIDTSFEANIQYVLFNQLLKKLGFVTNQQEQQTKASSTQRALVHDAYQLLQKTRVNARNVCVFMLGLIGIYNINPVNFEQGQTPDEQKQFNLDDVDGRKIQKQFGLFYRNRLSSQASRRIQQSAQNYSFKPCTNKQSNELAQKFRSNMLEEASKLIQECPELEFSIPEDGVISHTELLVLSKMAKDEKKKKKKQQMFDEELKQCTFKPNSTNSGSMRCSKMSESGNTHAGSKKSFQLYEYSKQVRSKKQSLQASRHSQSNPECTFKPQINKNKPPMSQPPVPMSKQTEQTLYRLYKGRQEHEEKQKFFERGEKIKQRKSSLKDCTQVPSLILDVNLGDKIDRIVLYRGDENRLYDVAHEFSLKHNMDEDSKLKLFQMLKTQLENVLAKIDEDQQSEECEL